LFFHTAASYNTFGIAGYAAFFSILSDNPKEHTDPELLPLTANSLGCSICSSFGHSLTLHGAAARAAYCKGLSMNLSPEMFTAVLVEVVTSEDAQEEALKALETALSAWIDSKQFAVDGDSIAEWLPRLHAGFMLRPKGQLMLEMLRNCTPPENAKPEVHRFVEAIAAMTPTEADRVFGAERKLSFRVFNALHQIKELRDSLRKCLAACPTAVALISFRWTVWTTDGTLTQAELTWCFERTENRARQETEWQLVPFQGLPF
jgi:hypothetical protein